MSTTDSRSPAVGALAGVVAYILGYLVVYATTANRVNDSLSTINAVIQLLGGDPIPTWKAVGWVYYNAHFVGLTYPNPISGTTATTNVIAQSELSALLYLIPAVVLFAAGLATAQTFDLRDTAAGLRAGVSVTVGYGLLAALGVFAVTATRSGATLQPDPVTGVLLAALVYPVVFGGLGGLTGTVLD